MFYVLPVMVKNAVIKKIALDNLFGCLPFSTSKFDGLKTYRGPVRGMLVRFLRI